MILTDILTNDRIERYSRQIIVAGVGGRAQERLLAARAALVAEPADAAAALAYLAGAGVGRIAIYPVGDRAPYAALVERTRDLNSDVTATLEKENAQDETDEASSGRSPATYDLLLALIEGPRTAGLTERLARERRARAAIVARLDTPPRIAILPAPPPCPLCAGPDLQDDLQNDVQDDLQGDLHAHLLAAPGGRAANAGVVAMAAVAEAFKLLAGYAGLQLESALIEFDGYAARARRLGRERSGVLRCVCEAPIKTEAPS